MARATAVILALLAGATCGEWGESRGAQACCSRVLPSSPWATLYWSRRATGIGVGRGANLERALPAGAPSAWRWPGWLPSSLGARLPLAPPVRCSGCPGPQPRPAVCSSRRPHAGILQGRAVSHRLEPPAVLAGPSKILRANPPACLPVCLPPPSPVPHPNPVCASFLPACMPAISCLQGLSQHAW